MLLLCNAHDLTGSDYEAGHKRYFEESHAETLIVAQEAFNLRVEQMKILLVGHFFPYPPRHGSAVDIWGQILSLNDLGYTIDLVATGSAPPTKDDVAIVLTKVRNCVFVERRRTILQVISPYPFQFESRRALETVPLLDTYDVVLLQTEYVAGILSNKSLNAARRILRVHNNEAEYYYNLYKTNKNVLEALFFWIESMKFRIFSPRIWRQCQQLWFISEFERDEYRSRRPKEGEKAVFLPTRVDITALRPYQLARDTVLFVGALTRSMNRMGLEWYLKYVHSELGKLENYRFVVVGFTNGEPIDWLKSLCDPFSNISLHPDVESLDAFYENSAVFVNPVFAGAGVKLKTINALEAGLPVVTTTVGAEGTGLLDHDHILIANAPEAFAECIRSLLSCPDECRRLVGNAQAHLKAQYDQKQRISSLLNGGIT